MEEEDPGDDAVKTAFNPEGMHVCVFYAIEKLHAARNYVRSYIWQNFEL